MWYNTRYDPMLFLCTVKDKDNHARQIGIKYIYGLVIVSLQPK